MCPLIVDKDYFVMEHVKADFILIVLTCANSVSGLEWMYIDCTSTDGKSDTRKLLYWFGKQSTETF